MRISLLGLMVAASIVFGLWSDPGSAADILGARIGVRSDATRFVIDLSAKANFVIAQKSASERIVIDLPKSVLAKGSKLPKSGKGLIRHVMVVGQGKASSQVLLFLKKPAQVMRSFRLPAKDSMPYRVVVDLAPQ